MKVIAIMQPYFLPYLGYWQLMNCADKMVLYDNVEYTKKGWINRNQYLLDGQTRLFSLPLKKGSDYQLISERYLADDSDKQNRKTLAKIEAAYRYAPLFREVMPLLHRIFVYPDKRLYEFIFNSIVLICEYLEIEVNLIRSSRINIDHSLKSQDKVISVVKALSGKIYINPKGGKHLYSDNAFNAAGIKLKFIEPHLSPYDQMGKQFVPSLSIIDVMMFNDVNTVQKMLSEYRLTSTVQ